MFLTHCLFNSDVNQIAWQESRGGGEAVERRRRHVFVFPRSLDPYFFLPSKKQIPLRPMALSGRDTVNIQTFYPSQMLSFH